MNVPHIMSVYKSIHSPEYEPHRLQLLTWDWILLEIMHPSLIPQCGDEIERYLDSYFIIKQQVYQIHFIDHTQVDLPLIYLFELNTISSERFKKPDYLRLP